MQGQGPGAGSVLLIKGIDSSRVYPDTLVALFGVYGDVIKVKMLGERTSALVQMAHAAQAAAVMELLDGVPLAGLHLQMERSRQGSVNDRKAHDFSDSPMHRFKGRHLPHPRYEATIFPPSTHLHIANVGAGTSEDELLLKLEEFGELLDFRFLPQPEPDPATPLAPGPPMAAVVEYAELESAVHALVMVHNLVLHGHALCVSFASPTLW